MTVKAKRRRRKAARKGESSLDKLRSTITLEALIFEVEKLLELERRDASEWTSWGEPIIAQIRISRADLRGRGTSESPERQLRRIAKYCVRYQLRPSVMCFEAQSGHLTDKKPRKQFRELFERVQSGDLDVSAIVTYNIDRFTRDKFVGESWFRLLRDKHIDLYEADEMEEPKRFEQMEDSYTGKLHAAWRESKRTSARIREAHADISDQGRLISGYNDAFGHDYIVEPNADGVPKRVGLRAVESEAMWLQEATLRLAAKEPLHSIFIDFNERGLDVAYNVLKRQLTAPRICGLQKVQGELKPANIEQIVSREAWARNCERLASEDRKEYRRHPLTGMLICGACGSPMHGGRDGNGDARYRCSKRALRRTRRCRCGRPDGRCVCRASRGRAAADGLVHPSRKASYIEQYVAMIVRLAYDERRLAQVATGMLASSSAASAEAEANTERERLVKRRQAIASLVARGLVEEHDAIEELTEIVAALQQVEEELTRLRSQRTQATTSVDPDEFARRLSSEGPGYFRAQVNHVIDHIVVEPLGRSQRPFGGLEVHFVAGYEVPQPLLDTLTEHLNDEWSAEQWLGRTHGRQTNAETESLVFELWSSTEMSSGDIAKRLNADGIPTVNGLLNWNANRVTPVVRRACARRGVEYVPRRTSRSPYPPETRRLIYELCRENQPFSAVVAELRRLNVQPPTGEWTDQRVRGVYASECSARGAKPVGRKPYLTPETRRTIRILVRVEGRTYGEAAEWLTRSGIKRQNGKAWTAKTVEYILRSEERKLASGTGS